MAKRRVKKEVPLTRKQVSRREKERRQRLILIIVAAVVASLIVVLLAYGAYTELVVKPSEPVAVVNGVPIFVSTYQQRVRLQRMSIDTAIQGLQLQRSGFDPDTDQFAINYIDQQLSQLSIQRLKLDSEALLDDLIEEELTRQAAEESGVVVSDEEIDGRIEESFGYYRDEATDVASPTSESITTTTEVSPTLTPTGMTRAEFDDVYNDYLSTVREGAGMSEEELRETVEAQILREKMEEVVTQEVPTTELHIRARQILLDTKAEAEVVLDRLEEGEDFATLAEELSKDPGSAELGGDLGWFARGMMVPEFDEVAFSLEPGEMSGVVETSFGFHIIVVEERDEERELEAAMLNERKREAFEVWLLHLRAGATIESYWSADKVPPE
jgi:parvulin-like peptidyl-prolyl isomerase